MGLACGTLCARDKTKNDNYEGHDNNLFFDYIDHTRSVQSDKEIIVFIIPFPQKESR